MNLSASAKQAFDKLNTLLDRAAHHPVMDKIDHGLQMLKPEAVKAGLSRVARTISENPAVRAVTAYTDTQITRAANSAAMERLRQYAILVRLNKPIGILLLLWPTMISLWIAAQGWPDTLVLVVFVMGVILMRSAGCAINDYADRDIDGSVARTKDRPLVSGKVSEKEALIVFAILSICAFGLVLLMNRLTIMMSLVGVVLAASYPFMKRYHFLPQVHLGAAFGWAVPMAYTAQANELTPVTWLLFLATVLWTTAYDTMYAMTDREDDLKIGVKSTAILFGPLDKKIIGAIQAMLIMALILIGQRAELSGFYYAGVVAATVLAIWQQYLIKDREPALCFEAFLNNNWFGLVLFIGLVLDYQFKGIT
jgi:4-hydroxybenzoate polyprenyltransferase